MSTVKAIEEALELFILPGQVVEIRAPKPIGRGFMAVGYFDDLHKAAIAAASIDGKYESVYFTPNPLDPALMARAANRLSYKPKPDTAKDEHVQRRRWLLIDCDAERPAGISSTDAEHAAALARIREIADWLTNDMQWPRPVVGDSGNGGHLCYWIDLPNNEAATRLVEGCLAALGRLFSRDGLKIDPAVGNASRIWKLYGTMAKKGDSVPERPHRRAQILSVPETISEVSPDQLQALADLAPKKELPREKARQDRDEVAEAQAALDAIDPRRADEYKTWIDVGMALSELGATGLAMWEAWSARSAKYEAGACAKKWRTFTGSGLTLASVFGWADQDSPGWRQPRRVALPAAAVTAMVTAAVDMVALLKSIRDASEDAKAAAVEDAVRAIQALPEMQRDAALQRIKKTAEGMVSKAAIEKLARELRDKPPEAQEKKTVGDESSRYHLSGGELWAGYGKHAERILTNGAAWWAEMVQRDDGASVTTELEMAIEVLNPVESVRARVPAEASGDAAALVKAIKAAVGPLISVSNAQKNLLPEALDEVSRERMRRMREIERTGWLATDDGQLVFVTPGGIIGELPEDTRVKLPEGLQAYAIRDDGDEAFAKGKAGLLHFLSKAFPEHVTMPIFAYVFLPPAARFIEDCPKFWLHLGGETGSHKTTAAKLLMALYGDFSKGAPLANFRSTINSLERLGFFAPDCLGIIDDYKPVLVKNRDFVDMVHRYADGNDRARLTSGSDLMVRRPPRWWVLSTGEDVPVGEASLLARMIVIRFPRRKEAYNAELALAQRHAKFFPTVMARWIKWLRADGANFDWSARLTLAHQQLAAFLSEKRPSTPNINRLARNAATLQAVWAAWWQFYWASGAAAKMPRAEIDRNIGLFLPVAQQMLINQALQVEEQRPVTVFLGALQDGIDAGKYELLETGQSSTTALRVLIGWYDSEGVYLLPSSYDEVAKAKFQSQQPIGFSRAELYRLLAEAGLFAGQGRDSHTITIKVGSPLEKRTKRVLHLKRNALSAGKETDQ